MTITHIISKENIKPSPPHPHPKFFTLSILDQLIPAPYAPIILFYPNQHLPVKTRLHHLKNSLSETLTHFYPLAGTIKDDLSIDCNDAGAYFATAQVNTRLDGFLTRPDLSLVNRLLPCEPGLGGGSEGSCVTNVQVNIFQCGGMAIGLCISHKILDGAALSGFLNGWAGTGRGSKEVLYPDLSAGSLFPANDLWLKDSATVMWGSLFEKGKCSVNRFVFGSDKLAELKTKAVVNGSKDPTRVEVVSALLWKCLMAAFEEKAGSWKPSLLSHVVNLRKRESTLPENSIGNLIWISSSECKADTETQLSDLVEKVRGSVSKIDSEFVKKMQGNKGPQVMEESLKRIKDSGRSENVDYIGFTSWCKMGFYDVDFGWGKPAWVCSSVCDGNPVFMNFVVLVDTRCGDGIEAWVSIDEQDMCVLKRNPELLAYASLDPSPLQESQ